METKKTSSAKIIQMNARAQPAGGVLKSLLLSLEEIESDLDDHINKKPSISKHYKGIFHFLGMKLDKHPMILRFFLFLSLFLASSIYGHSQSLKALADKAEELMMTNIDSSLVYFKKLENLALEQKDSQFICDAIYYQAALCNHTNQYHKTRIHLKRGMPYTRNTRDTFEYLMVLGQSYDQNELNKSDSIYLEAEKLANIIQDKYVFGHVYNFLGQGKFLKGQFHEALEYQLLILEKHIEGPLQLAHCYQDIAELFLILNNIDLADEYVQKAIIVAEENNFKRRHGPISRIYAEILLAQNKKQEALDEINHSIDFLETKGSSLRFQALNNNTKATILMSQENWDAAQLHLDKAFAIRKNVGSTDFTNLFPLLLNKCKILLHQQKYADVITETDEIFEIIYIYENLIYKKEVLEYRRIALEKTNQINLAYTTLSQLKNIEDSLFKKDQVFMARYLETQYNRKEQASSITLLNTENELQGSQLSQQKRFLTTGGIALFCISILSFFLFRLFRKVRKQKTLLGKALDEKDTLLREIHHRVKNNLQLVSSLLGLQSQHIQDPNALEALNSGKARVKSMALIHQDLYNKESLTGVSVNDYLQKLCKELFFTFQVAPDKVELNLDIADLELDVDTLVPFGLIINELLTNTLKYAFPDDKTGRIDIHIYEQNKRLRLDFADNGIGIDNSKQSKSSFGYKLINTLLDQLEGEMKQESVNGTQLYFSFEEYKIAA